MPKQMRCIGLVLLGASFAAAGAGQLKPVACNPEQAVFPPLILQVRLTEKATQDAGAVSSRAIIGKVRGRKPPLKLALDHTAADSAEPDVVLFDFAGKGKFDKAWAVRLRQVAAVKPAEFQAEFGPATIKVDRNGRTFPVTVRGMSVKLGGKHLAMFTFAAAVEGKCSFGEKAYPVRLIDNTGDFRFDEMGKFDRKKRQGMGLSLGDTVLVDTGDGTFATSAVTAYYGQPVFVDGAWYEVTVSADGEKVSAKRLQLDFGRVAMDRGKCEAALVNAGKVFAISGGKMAAAVPAGKYELLYYREWSAPNAEGKRGWLLAIGPEYAAEGKPGKTVSVRRGKTTRLAMGSPLKFQIGAKVEADRTVKFSLSTPEARGNVLVYLIVRPGGWLQSPPEPPKVDIQDASGKRVATVQLEYG